jgi:hypothetical protein
MLELADVKPPEFQTNKIDARTWQDMDRGIARWVNGVKREVVPFTLEFKNQNRLSEFTALVHSTEKADFRITVGGMTFKFQGFVVSVRTFHPVDSTPYFTVQIKTSGPMNITEEITRMETKYPEGSRHQQKTPAPGMKKFYVGSNSMPSNWTHDDHKGALEHATELLNAEGGPDEVFIVEVKTVVKKKTAPVIVSKFKAPRKLRG